MKILFFSPEFYPSKGGVARHVYEISRILSGLGHDVVVVTELLFENNYSSKNQIKYVNQSNEDDGFHGIKKGEYLRLKYFGKIKVYYFDFGNSGKNKKFRIWHLLFKYRKLIKHSDIVHCHDVFIWYLPFRFLFPHKKVYTTFHGYESYPVMRKAIFIRKVSEILSYGNICVGDFISKWYGTSPSAVIYGGVNVNKFKIYSPMLKVKKESSVFIGRLDAQTGIDMYCDAVRIIKKKVPEFKFLVIGDGKKRGAAEEVGIVLGFKKNPEQYFTSYRFAFVSRYLSILEALAAKRLVFAVYDNDIKKDYLLLSPFSKYIVIVNTPEQLAEKVLYFLSHPEEEKKTIEQGYEFVKKQTWSTVVKIYVNLWKSK